MMDFSLYLKASLYKVEIMKTSIQARSDIFRYNQSYPNKRKRIYLALVYLSFFSLKSKVMTFGLACKI